MAYKSLADIIKPQEEEPVMSEMAPTDYENMQSPVAPDMVYSAPKLADALSPKQEQPEVPMLAEVDTQQPSPQAPDTRTDYEKLEAKLQELRGLDAARQETAGKYNFGAKAAAILGDTLARYSAGGIQKNAKANIQYTGPKLSEAMAMIGEVKAPSTTEQKQTLIDQYKQLALNERAKNKLYSEDARAKRSEDLRRELNKAQIEGSLKEAGIKASGKLIDKESQPSFKEKEEIKAKVKEGVQVAKENRDLKKQLEPALANVNDQIKNVKDALNLINNSKFAGTGPLDQYFVGATPEGQLLKKALGNISLDTLVQKFQGMSRAIDTETDRKFFQETQPSMGNFETTNKKMLGDILKRLEDVKAKSESKLNEIGPQDEGIKENKDISKSPNNSLSKKDQAALEWAKANPDNQDAIEILKLNKK
jgi:hypothetical protein